MFSLFFFFNDTATTEIYTLSLHDALPISHTQPDGRRHLARRDTDVPPALAVRGLGHHTDRAEGEEPRRDGARRRHSRSEEHTSELQSRQYLVCRLLLEKKKTLSYHFLIVR